MDYQLICMSFDGEYVKDYKGSFEGCNNTSNDIGSKWFFYPFHFIIDENKMIESADSSLFNMKTRKPILNELFKYSKLNKVIEVFKKINQHCINNDLECDCDQFEILIIDEIINERN